MTAVDRERWDAKYAERPWPSEIAPPEWLTRHAKTIPPGRALDLACGEGRAAIWLAEQGWEVTAVDISPVGLSRAKTLADERNLTISWVTADLDDFPLGQELYDLITVFRFLDRPLAARIPGALRRGGWVIYETFLSAPTAGIVPENHVRNPAFRLQPGELPRLFEGLVPIAQEEVEIEGEWVARLAARKP
jgi:SAM-dependent methyltransferase